MEGDEVSRKRLIIEWGTNGKYFRVYAIGPVYASVCTDMEPSDAVERLNREYPTEAGPWFLSKDKTFSGGEPMPCVCHDDETRTHYLFNC